MVVTIFFASIHIILWNAHYTAASSSFEDQYDFDSLDEYCKLISSPISTFVVEKNPEASTSESNEKVLVTNATTSQRTSSPIRTCVVEQRLEKASTSESNQKVLGSNATKSKGREKMKRKINKKGKAIHQENGKSEIKKEEQLRETIIAPRKDITAFHMLGSLEKESLAIDGTVIKNRVLLLYNEYEKFLFEKPTGQTKKLLKNKKKICASYNNQLYGQKVCDLLIEGYRMEEVAPVTCVQATVNRMDNWGLRDVALCKMKLPENMDDRLITCPITGMTILKRKMSAYRKKNAIIKVGLLDGPAPQEFFVAIVHDDHNPGAVTLVNEITYTGVSILELFQSETVHLRKGMEANFGDQVVRYAEGVGEPRERILDRTITNACRLVEEKEIKGTEIPINEIITSEIWKPVEDEETANKIKEEKEQILEAFKNLR